MPQVLKEHLRNSIIEAAKEEFLKYGFKDASMRRIARNANMTVGNLYRYFKNKDDINISIVGETYKEINDAIKKITSNKLSFETRVFDLHLDISELRTMLDTFSEELVDIYDRNPVEFKILMLHSNLNYEMEIWFSQIIKSLILKSYLSLDFEHEFEILSRSFAAAIFAGITELFTINDVDIDKLKKLLKLYFRTYLYSIDKDIRLLLD